MSSLYLNDDLHPDAFSVGSRLAVWGTEARHAAQVARVRTGERIAIGDGRGRLAWGRVVHVAQQEVAIEASEIVVDSPPRPTIVLVQALAKGDRDELAVQAATELGVAEVVPWQAARSVSRWVGPKEAKGLDRWRGIVREAAKQAIRPTVPTVRGLLSTPSLVAAVRDAGTAEVGSCGTWPVGAGLVLVLEPTARDALVALATAGEFAGVSSITLVVGPEGGIAAEELDALTAVGARPVRLGAEVLRTSTAGPAALAALRALLATW